MITLKHTHYCTASLCTVCMYSIQLYVCTAFNDHAQVYSLLHCFIVYCMYVQHSAVCMYSIQLYVCTAFNCMYVQHSTVCMYSIQLYVCTAFSCMYVQHSTVCMYSIQLYVCTAFNCMYVQHSTVCMYSIQLYVCTAFSCMYVQHSMITLKYTALPHYICRAYKGMITVMYYICVPIPQRGDASSAVLQVKRHILQVSTHQMAVLLLFNKKTNISFQVLCRVQACI